MNDFVFPGETYLSLDAVYPELERYGKELIERLELLLPEFIRLVDYDEESNDRLKYAVILEKFLKEFPGQKADSVFDLYFCLNPYTSKLCGREHQDLLLNSLDWSGIFSSRQFFVFLKNEANALMFQQLFTENRNCLLFDFLSQLKFSDKYTLLKQIEERSPIKPFFPSSILFSIENVPHSIQEFNVVNFWIFNLPPEIRDYILQLTDPDSINKPIPREMFYSESGYHRHILPYITEERKSILDQLYQDVSTKKIITDIQDFVYNADQKDDWFACQSEEDNLPIPQFSSKFDGVQSFIDNCYETMYAFGLEKMIADKDCFHKELLFTVFQNDYSLWEQVNSFIDEDDDSDFAIKTFTTSLMETILDETFIEELNQNLKEIKIDFSVSYNPPEIFKSFLDQLLFVLSGAYESNRNILFLFFLNSLYSGPISQNSNCDWYNAYKKTQFSQVIYSVLTSQDEKQIQHFFNFQNIEIEGFECFDNSSWYEWVLAVTTEKFRIVPDKLQTKENQFLTSYMDGMKNPELILLTNPTLATIYNPIIENIFEALKSLFEYGYGSLSSILSIFLMMKHYPPYLELVKQYHEKFKNDNGLIPLLAHNPEYFDKNIILDTLLKSYYFQSFSFKDAELFGLAKSEIKQYILEKITVTNLTYRKLEDRIWGISNVLYTWTDDVNNLGILKQRESLNQMGIEIINTLINKIVEEDQFNSQGLILVNQMIRPLRNISFLTDNQQKSLIKAAKNQFYLLRRIVRNLDNFPENNLFLETITASGIILEKIDDKSKLLNNLLTTFKQIQETTIGSNLEVNHSEVSSTFTNIAILIHNILDRTHEKDGVKIRKEMTEFLVDKLKPLKTVNPDRLIGPIPDYIGDAWDGWAPNYTEPDPVWRFAYVHAIKNLGIHSRGRNHYYAPLLFNSANTDPSEKVRKAALNTAKELNNLRKGYATGSHKRHLLNAWWWIRQAHVISTGGTPDPEGAQKTRIKEVRN